MTSPLYVLGVDPGSVSGWALVGINASGPPMPILWGAVGGSGWPRGPLTLDAIKRAGASTGALCDRWIAVEDQFVKDKAERGGRDRAKAISTLETARHAGGWIYLAESRGWRLFEYRPKSRLIPPQTWRAATYGRGGGRLGTGRAKEAALDWAARLYSIRLKASWHHVAEAIHIAAFAATEIRTRNQQEGLTL